MRENQDECEDNSILNIVKNSAKKATEINVNGSRHNITNNKGAEPKPNCKC